MESHTYFEKLFDDVLQGDPTAVLLFTNMILKHGISMVSSISEKINYTQKQDIYKVACKTCLNVVQEISVHIQPAKVLYGCRQNSNTFIVYQESDCSDIKVLEGDKVLPVSKLHKYHSFIKKGWTKMSPLEIVMILKNNSITFNEDTIVDPPPPIKRKRVLWLLPVLAAGTVIFGLLRRNIVSRANFADTNNNSMTETDTNKNVMFVISLKAPRIRLKN